ncbi:MAG: response regulator [Deltaproteobacteria bacterium]
MTKFCPACGENVETYIIDRMGFKEMLCIHCGMIVEDMSHKKVIPAELVIAADDSLMIVELLKEMMVKGSLATEVVGCHDGVDFLSTFIRKLKEENSISLVILDVAMPLLNGVNAAIALRAVEKGLNIPPTPILFFTAQKCDENFQKVLTYCKPAEYVNKGISSTPDQLASRIKQVTIKLLSESQSPK